MNPAIIGTSVCRMHGGGAPQVREAARNRLLAAVDPAFGRLTALLDSDDERVALQAAKAILERAGIGSDLFDNDMPTQAMIDRWIKELEREPGNGHVL